MEYAFELTMQVREYECDLQGIVNNAIYQHYLEHTRNEFLRREGITSAELHYEGIDTVVARISMVFKTPLRPNDMFVSRLALRKEGIRYVFIQDIFRQADEKHVFHADVDIVCIINGRPRDCEKLNNIFAKYFC